MATNSVPQSGKDGVERFKRALLDATPEARRAAANRLAEIFVAGLKAHRETLSSITADLTEQTEEQYIDQTATDLLTDVNI